MKRPWTRLRPGPDAAATRRVLDALESIGARSRALAEENRRLEDGINTREAERVQLRMRAEAAEATNGELLAEVERLRATLAEFGTVRMQWGVQHPLFGSEYIQGSINASAECLRRNAANVRPKWSVVTRLVGEWRRAN